MKLHRSNGKLHSSGSSGIRRSAATPVLGATAITVTDYTNQRVFQRKGTTAPITVSGTYSGAAGPIQVRVVPHGTAISSTAYTWTTLVASPIGGTFSAPLTVAQGGWYNIQVRDSVSLVAAKTNNKFGVGMIIGMIGQSNMVHLWTSVLDYPIGAPLSVDYVWPNYRRIGNFNDSYAPNTKYPYAAYATEGVKGDGYVYFANLVSAGLGIPVCLIPQAVIGSTIDQWQNGQTYWNNFAGQVQATGSDMEAALWFQGEANAASMTSATYYAKLTNIHNQCHTLTGRNSSNFHFGVITLGPTATVNSGTGNIRTAHINYVNTVAGAFLAGCAHDTLTVDGIHISSDGQARLGRRYARTFLSRIAGGSLGQGPKITSATIAGAVITVNIAHTGGTSLRDGANGAGAALTGFNVYDGGVAAPISSTAISGNTVLLTLASVPTGTVTMSYGLGDAPHGNGYTFVAASCVYDNDSYYNGTMGYPLQPKPLMPVT